MSQRDVALFGTRDFARQLELENTKLLEVARAAKKVNLVRLVDPCNPERTVGMLPIANRKTIEVWNAHADLTNALKSLEESGVKI